ncbi:MAG TPA: hypothetical protein VFE05_10775, partial [Longimicrobiaceae bacterium]|nr:hypothetical protein [Longimicrobiaceae bacterium]
MIRTIRRALRASLFAASFALPAGLAAQGGNDAGTFRIWVGGQPVGTEEFSIRSTGSGSGGQVVASGRVNLRLPTGTLELAPRLRATGIQSDPVAYEVEIGGDSPRRIVGTVGNGRFSEKTVTASGEQLHEYVASAGAVVLDEGVAHHYYFIAQRGPGRIPVLIPRENRQALATVTNRGEESVEINGKRV